MLQFFAVEREAELLEAMAQRGAAGVLAEHEMRLGDADRRGGHDFVAERVGQHAVLVNAGLVSESVIADDGLVGGGLEGDDLAEGLAGGVKIFKLDVGGDAVAITADVEGGGDLFQSRVACALADAVNGALDLASAVLNGGKGVGDGKAEIVMAVGGENDALGIDGGDAIADFARTCGRIPQAWSSRRYRAC